MQLRLTQMCVAACNPAVGESSIRFQLQNYYFIVFVGIITNVIVVAFVSLNETVDETNLPLFLSLSLCVCVCVCVSHSLGAQIYGSLEKIALVSVQRDIELNQKFSD